MGAGGLFCSVCAIQWGVPAPEGLGEQAVPRLTCSFALWRDEVGRSMWVFADG